MTLHGSIDVMKVVRDVEGLPSDEYQCNGVPSTLHQMTLDRNINVMKVVRDVEGRPSDG